MDLIYTDANGVDQGVLSAYDFDLSYGATENDFELLLGADEATLEPGSFIYMDGEEYGGIVGGIKASTNGETVTYTGRTWHGILNSKVIEPDSGEDYFVVSGEANAILSDLIDRLGLSGLFSVVDASSGIEVESYQFHRYCKGYNGIRALLTANGAKLHIERKDRAVQLSAVPAVDYSQNPVDCDVATLIVEQHEQKVNHLVCLGKGELSQREVIHLYVDQFGRIGDTQYYTGLDEVADTYENTASEDLRSDGIKRFKELRDTDKADISLSETEGMTFDIGDIVGATEYKSGISVAAVVTQKIVQINNGVVHTEYKAGS